MTQTLFSLLVSFGYSWLIFVQTPEFELELFVSKMCNIWVFDDVIMDI